MSSPDRIQEARQWFQQAQRNDRLAHAYLVIGSPQGDARDFIEAVLPLLLCESGGNEACGRCPACRSLRDNRHPNLVHIEPQGKSRTIPVDVMRDLLHRFGQTTLSGGRKIAVIWGAERLGEEAANAFLKTLEEPPEGSLFFLITPAPSSVLPTVRSRCQRLALSEPQPDLLPDAWLTDLFAILETLEPDDSGRQTAAWNGFAAAQRFLALCSVIREDAQQVEKEAADETDEKEALAARGVARFKEQRTLVLQALQLWYRDVLLNLCGAHPDRLRYRDRIDAIRRSAARLSVAGILKKIERLETLHRQLESNIPDSVVIHTAFTELASW